MPVVQAREAMERLQVGQTMELIATDPGSGVDMPAWAANTGHELVSSEHNGATFRFIIRRAR
jgi:tRNA 2-thiouridine synthesizing protein A